MAIGIARQHNASAINCCVLELSRPILHPSIYPSTYTHYIPVPSLHSKTAQVAMSGRGRGRGRPPKIGPGKSLPQLELIRRSAGKRLPGSSSTAGNAAPYSRGGGGRYDSISWTPADLKLLVDAIESEAADLANVLSNNGTARSAKGVWPRVETKFPPKFRERGRVHAMFWALKKRYLAIERVLGASVGIN